MKPKKSEKPAKPVELKIKINRVSRKRDWREIFEEPETRTFQQFVREMKQKGRTVEDIKAIVQCGSRWRSSADNIQEEYDAA